MWLAVLAGAAGCYLLKLSGAVVPARILDDPLVKRIVMLLPVALLCALVAVQTVGNKQQLVVDARLPAFIAAVVMLRLKRSFITVVLTAAICAAVIRHFGLLP